MPSANSGRTPWWAWTWPVLALAVLGVHTILSPGIPFAAAEAFVLIATVFAAVYHAEVIAHRVGEPFGSLVLALAVTFCRALRCPFGWDRPSRPRHFGWHRGD